MNAIERADKAAAILKSPVFEEAFDLVRQKLLTGIESCPFNKPDEAERYRVSLKLLGSVRGNLITAVNSGKLDAYRIDQDEKRKQNPIRRLFP